MNALHEKGYISTQRQKIRRFYGKRGEMIEGAIREALCRE
jgi:hypothetical protein